MNAILAGTKQRIQGILLKVLIGSNKKSQKKLQNAFKEEKLKFLMQLFIDEKKSRVNDELILFRETKQNDALSSDFVFAEI